MLGLIARFPGLNRRSVRLGGTATTSAAAAVLAWSVIQGFATGGPDNFLGLEGAMRNQVTSTPTSGVGVYDWGNHGSAYDLTACGNGGINAADTAGTLGTGGIFNCGKAVPPSGTNTNPLPVGPTETAAALADTTITHAQFIVDPLYESNNKNTGITCPVNGAAEPSNNKGDPTSFPSNSGSDKNDLPFSGFSYAPGSLQPKDDLGNVYALSRETTSISEVYFGAERVVNNGASHIDFEFLQSALTLAPNAPASTSCAGTFNGHRTGGDFLAAVDFTTGGSLGSNTIYVWSCGGSLTTIQERTQCDPGSVAFPNAQYVAIPSNDPRFAAFTLKVNTPATPIPCGGWVCRGEETGDTVHAVSTNEFMEGGVNLGTLGFTGCVSTFLPHTRSSPDINSTLQDFAGPVSINNCTIGTAPTDRLVKAGTGTTDVATVTGFTGPAGGFGCGTTGQPACGSTAAGGVDFKVYGPFSSAPTATSCVDTGTGKTLASDLGISAPPTSVGAGNSSPATYTSGTFTPTATGIYQWVASYVEPGGSIGAAGACGDSSETFAAVSASTTIGPSAVNEVGHSHTFTLGGSASYPGGVTVTAASLTPSLTPTTGFTVGTNTCGTQTIAAAQTSWSCSYQISSTTATSFTANGTFSVSFSYASATLTLSPTTDGTGSNSGSATKDFVDAHISISPSAVNEVGTAHTFTVTLTAVPSGDTTAGSFSISPSVLPTTTLLNNTCGSNLTAVSNVATCTFQVNSTSATSFTASASGSVVFTDPDATTGHSPITVNRSTDGTHGSSGSATKDYVDAHISISPSAVNEVGTAHTFTVTLTALPGGDTTTGSFNITPHVSPTTTILNSTCGSNLTATTNVATCTFQINSTSATSYTASADGSVTFTDPDGSTGHTTATVNRSTGDGLHSDGANAIKDYVDANISISPSAVNEVGTAHTFTVTLTAIPSGDTTAGTFDITPHVSPTTTILNSTCGNNLTASSDIATCTFEINSTTATSYSATADGSVVFTDPDSTPTANQTVTVDRSTDGTHGSSGAAVKDYADANIAISPSAVNEVGTAHTFTVTLTADPSGDTTAGTFDITPHVSPTTTILNSTCGNNLTATANVATCTFQINSTTATSYSATADGSVVFTDPDSTPTANQQVTVDRSTDSTHGSSGAAVKDYADANIAISPSAVNEVGTPHTFTVTLTAEPSGDTTAGTFDITPHVSPTTTILNSTCGNSLTATANVATCTFQINSTTATSYSATADGSVVFTDPDSTPTADQTVTVDRSTDGTHGSSGAAVKDYVDANISVTPSGINEVGSPHTFTFTLTGLPSGDSTAGSFDISPTISPMPTTLSIVSNDCGNNLTPTGNVATCQVEINSTSPGVFTASATGSVTFTDPDSTPTANQQVTVDRATGDGLHSDGANVTKTYVDAIITLALGNTPDPVGTTESVTATVTVNDGTHGWVAASDNTTVTMSIVPNADATPSVGSFTTSSPFTCLTSAGSCTLHITSNVAGETTVHATASPVVDTVTVTRSTSDNYVSGDGVHGDGDDVIKTWTPVTPNLSTTPSSMAVTQASTNNTGAGVSDVANVTGGLNPGQSGDTVTFDLYGPFNNTSSTAAPTFTCTNPSTGVTGNRIVEYAGVTSPDATGDATFTSPTFNTATSAGLATGTYQWVAHYIANDGANVSADGTCGDTSEQFTVDSISTTPSTGTLGSPMTDEAIVNGGQNPGGTGAPGGTVTFHLYGPFQTTGAIVCTSALTLTGTNPITADGTSYSRATFDSTQTSPSFTPTTAGIYQWVASYSGNANDAAVAGACNDSSEQVTVSPAHPSLSTTPSSTAVTQAATSTTGAGVSDTANVTGGFNPGQSGDTVTFDLYGPFNSSTTTPPTITCTDPSTGVTGNRIVEYAGVTSSNATGDATFTSPTFKTAGGLATGTYQWVAHYIATDGANVSTDGTCPDTTEQFTVDKITTTPSGLVQLGGNVSDTATVAGGKFPGGTGGAGGTVTFKLYGPFSGTITSTSCGSGNLVFTSAAMTANSGATYSSASFSSGNFSPAAGGTYQWVASYSGNANDAAVSGACGDTSEQVVVQPPLAQITPTNTDCSSFSAGTSGTLDAVFYHLKSGSINSVNPGVFFYWDKLVGVNTSAAQTFKITQSTSYSRLFLIASGSFIYSSGCTVLGGVTPTQNTTDGSVSFTIPAGTSGSTFFIGIKYSAGSVVGDTPPTTTCHDNTDDGNLAACADYSFATVNTTGGGSVLQSGSPADLDLAPQGSTIS